MHRNRTFVQTTDIGVRCLASNLSQEPHWPLWRAHYEGLRVGKKIATTAFAFIIPCQARLAGR